MKKVFLLLAFFVFNASLLAQGSWQSIYEVVPDVANCKSGKLTAAEQQKVVSFINQIRKLHGLQPLIYKADGLQAAMDAALICVANAQLDHYPKSNVQCFSKSGEEGCGSSNLHLSSFGSPTIYPSEKSIIGWLIDDHSLNAQTSAGHRRAILNPFVNGVAYGRVDGNPKVSGKENYFCVGSAMKYNYYSKEAVGLVNDFVAYPYQNYPPILVNKQFYLSFMAVTDKKELWNNRVDYTNVTITMKTETGENVAVSGIESDNEGWGSFPNAIHWKAAGLKDGVKYFVEIKGVKYRDENKEYSYWFKLTDEGVNTDLAMPSLTEPADKATNVVLTADFKWKAVPNAEKYEVSLSEAVNFPEDKTTVKTIAATTVKFDNLKKDKTYYWRVRAIKGEDKSDYSAIWSFTTEKSSTPPVTVFQTLYPKNNETNVDILPKLLWSKKDGAFYDLQVNTTEQFTSTEYLTVNEVNYKDTSYQIQKALYKKGTYFWRVRYKLPTASGEWTPISKFTTGNTTDVEIVEAQAGNVSQISVVPNPVHASQFDVKFIASDAGEYRLSVYDVLGKAYLQNIAYNAINGLNTMQLNLDLNSGSYFLVISDPENAQHSMMFKVEK